MICNYKTGMICVFLSLFFLCPAFAASPVNVSVTPSSGTFEIDRAYTFTATYQDEDGVSDIRFAEFLIKDGSASIRLVYRNTNNRLSLVGDNGQWLAGYAPGSNNTISNSYVTLDCRATAIDKNTPNTLIVRWSLSFKSAFAGAKSIYMAVTDRDPGRFVGWYKPPQGEITIPNPPPVVSLHIPSGDISVGREYVFRSTATGAAQIRRTHFLIGSDPSDANAVNAYYDRLENKLYLRSDAGSSFLGSNVSVENSRARFSAVLADGGAIYSLNNGNLLVSWRVVFKLGFTGANKLFVATTTYSGAFSGWAEAGSINIEPADDTDAPSLAEGVSFSPERPFTDTPVTMSTAFFDVNTAEDIIITDIKIGDGDNAFYLAYERQSNILKISGIGGQARWLGSYAAGSDNILENDYVKVLCAGTGARVEGDGKRLIISWRLIFKQQYAGRRNVYLSVTDSIDRQDYSLKGTAEISLTPQIDLGRAVASGAASYYSFNASSGDRFLIASASSAEIYGPLANSISPSVGTFTAGSDGQYILGIPAGAGFTLQRLNSPGNTSEVSAGDTEAAISLAGEMDSYVISGLNPGQVISFEVSSISQGGGFNPAFILYNERGGAVSYTEGSSLTAAEGRYFLYVYDDGYNDTGSYRISLRGSVPDTGAISFIPQDAAKFTEGQAVTLSSSATGSVFGVFSFRFSIDDEVVQDFSGDNDFEWRTSAADIGRHTLGVTARSSSGEASKESDIYIVRNPPDPE